MGASRRRASRADTSRISAKQRAHFAALLILALAVPAAAQSEGDIDFDEAITQAEIDEFTALVAQAIYATPVDPARKRGLLGLDVGIAVIAVPIDTDASYWERSVEEDFTVSGHLAVPRLVAAKGLGFATLSASYSKVPDTDIAIWGAALDVSIIEGGIVRPTLALRGAYSTLRGIEELDFNSYGLEVFFSKGFGPVTPYIAAGRTRGDATARITDERTMSAEADSNRFTLGVKLSLFIPKIVIEATQGETRSYAAKVSIGL